MSGVAPRRSKSSSPEIKLVGNAPRPLLEIDTLCIQRDGTKILREVDWTVRPGEHWVILGPNGSGKTSLLAALTGYFMPTSGDLMLLGEKFGESDWRKLREHIGIVSSSIRQRIPDYEPATEVVVGGKYAMIDFWGTPKPAEARAARQLLAGLDCAYLADREWGVLSQGERQRVLIARALIAKPELLILDEPCAGLDPVARERFLNWLDRLGRASSRPALVLVTHHVEEIMPAFTHVLMLKDGAVAATGPMKETLTSANLSKTFATRIRVQRKLGRYALALPREL